MSFMQAGKVKKLRCDRFLEETDAVIPWESMQKELSKHYRTGEGGRPAKELKLMLKIHCLQQWFHLSDPGVEEAIYDRLSFQKFLEIDLLSQSVPDESTVLHFRHFLEAHELGRRMFVMIQRHLQEKGLLLKEGTIVDATLIAAPSSTKNEAKKRDPEMSSTKKGNQWHFGMKMHIGVQAQGRPLIHTIQMTTAKEHDRGQLEKLLHGEEKAVFGDKGYFDEKNKRLYRDRGIFYGMLDRARRSLGLSSKQEQKNLQKSSVRSKVEHPFQILKCQWNYRKVRYRGITKNQNQLFLMAGLINLFMVRKVLLDPV